MKVLTIAAMAICVSTAVANADSDRVTLRNVSNLIIAGRDCDISKVTPYVTSSYITRYAKQEGISFDKAKYLAFQDADERYWNMVKAGTKDEFCLSLMD